MNEGWKMLKRMYKEWMKDERCRKGCIMNEWGMKDIEKDV